MKRIIRYMAIAVIMSSCGIYRKYPKQTEVSDDLFGQEYVSTDSASVAELSWREMFSDPYLQVLIDSALVRNTDLRTAYLRTEQAKAALMNARLAYLPSLELTASRTLSKMSDTKTKTYNIGGQDVIGKQCPYYQEEHQGNGKHALHGIGYISGSNRKRTVGGTMFP